MWISRQVSRNTGRALCWGRAHVTSCQRQGWSPSHLLLGRDAPSHEGRHAGLGPSRPEADARTATAGRIAGAWPPHARQMSQLASWRCGPADPGGLERVTQRRMHTVEGWQVGHEGAPSLSTGVGQSATAGDLANAAPSILLPPGRDHSPLWAVPPPQGSAPAARWLPVVPPAEWSRWDQQPTPGPEGVVGPPLR